MAEVTQLKTVNPPTIDTHGLCEALVTIVNRIEGGEFGRVYKAVLVIEGDESGVVAFSRGAEGFSTGNAIGLLEVAKFQIIENMD